jgi:pyridoxal 5'-phosphate synthase pdxT subunit
VAGDRLPVGILALQGDFAAHRRALGEHGRSCVEVRSAADLERLAGLILPGGESTTMLKLMAGTNLADALREKILAGTPVLATCAGVILLAREVTRPPQPSLAVLDVTVARNAYGRQVDSAIVPVTVEKTGALAADTLEGVFIRAPRIVRTGPGVEVLAWRGADPVLVRQGALLAATFHPELSAHSPVIDLFVHALDGGR